MLVRVPLLGRGTREDGYRVELPNYTMVEIDRAGHVALVNVPDEDVPIDERLIRELSRDATRRGGRRAWPKQSALDAWHAHIDERYREHAGRFRPVPV